MDKKLIGILVIVFGIIIAVIIACSCAGMFINDKPNEQKEQTAEQLGDAPDGKRIIFVNDDMWDTPPGWEFVIEKSESGNDILILRPVENTETDTQEDTPDEQQEDAPDEVTEELQETESAENEEQNDENKEVE